MKQTATNLLIPGGFLPALERGITSGMTGFPVRESLESEATLLMPSDTPIRNRLPRVAGSGKAAAWKQVTSQGGGWAPTPDQPGSAGAASVFFAEGGAPAELTSTYVSKSAAYKLLGQRGSVTGFAMAAGASFQDQLDTEKLHALRNLMILEENALINGSSTSTAAPWGDGTSALSFDGLLNLTTTANGVPTDQIQTGVGALTLAHLDAQLSKIWRAGGRGMYMMMNGQEVQSLRNQLQASDLMTRALVVDQSKAIAGLHVEHYVHPLSGELVQIIVSRFMPAGTILFGCDFGPDGRTAAEVEVLPQVLPGTVSVERVEGYVMQELAPAWNSPQVYGFLISVFEVLKMKNSLLFAKSLGVTAS